MTLNSLNSTKLASGENYKLNTQKITTLTNAPHNSDYFFVTSKTNTAFSSTRSNYSPTFSLSYGNTLWTTSLPTAFACYYFDVDNDNLLDNGEQLGFTFNGTSLTQNDTVTISGLTNTGTKYQNVLFALDDVATKTVYFNFFDSSGTNINTDMGYVTDPYTTSVPCAFPDNQGIYLVQIPQNADLSSMTVNFTGAFGNSYGVSLVGVVSSPTDFTTEAFPCFLDGTMIKTIEGEKNIATLKSGDKLLNKDNEIVTIEHVWVKDVVFAPENVSHNVYPNLIPKDYFGENKPNKDLWISPQHKISYNDVMIDSKYLQIEQQIIELPFKYYNITLAEGYGTMIANGCVVETYKRKQGLSVKDEKSMVLYN